MIENPNFINILQTKKLASAASLDDLHTKYKNNDFKVLLHLVQKKVASKNILGKLWGDSLGCAYIDLRTTLFPDNLEKYLTQNIAKKYNIIPLYEIEGIITIATANPTDKKFLKKLEELFLAFVFPVFAFPDNIEEAIDTQYQKKETLHEIIEKISFEKYEHLSKKLSSNSMDEIANDKIIIEFVRNLLCLSLKMRCSDIHIEPIDEISRIRFRIDGVLIEQAQLNIAFHRPLVSHIKILSLLDIAETRKPQDGNITFHLADNPIDIRVSYIPTIYGEKVVLRILGAQSSNFRTNLKGLFFSKRTYDSIKKVCKSPNGLFFVTGPTGSGKSTTLYSILKYLNSPGINIMTIENPVEYKIPGVNQLQVNENIKLDFASALRAFLRQDPDVIMVGEIRDTETASIASQAALTGHLVLATIHTNNSLQAIIRLNEMGVKPYIIAPSIIGVMGQRLVRRLCDHCKAKYEISSNEKDSLFRLQKERPVYFYKKTGCTNCDFTGYKGRIAIHEICLIDYKIRSLINSDNSFEKIKDTARKNGFHTMRYDGIKKVLRGLTTIDEINRVTFYDDIEAE